MRKDIMFGLMILAVAGGTAIFIVHQISPPPYGTNSYYWYLNERFTIDGIDWTEICNHGEDYGCVNRFVPDCPTSLKLNQNIAGNIDDGFPVSPKNPTYKFKRVNGTVTVYYEGQVDKYIPSVPECMDVIFGRLQ